MLELTLDRNVMDVAFSETGTRLAVLSDRDVALFAFDVQSRPIARPNFLWRSSFLDGHQPRRMTFVNDDKLCVLTDVWDEDETFLWVNEGERLVNRGPILESGGVSSIISDVESSKLLVALRNGEVTTVIEMGTDETARTTPLSNLPSFTPEIKTATLEGEVSISCLLLGVIVG